MSNQIYCLRGRCLCLIYSDRQAFFEAPLGKNSSVSVHDKCLKVLAIETCKVLRRLASTFFSVIHSNIQSVKRINILSTA